MQNKLETAFRKKLEYAIKQMCKDKAFIVVIANPLTICMPQFDLVIDFDDTEWYDINVIQKWKLILSNGYVCFDDAEGVMEYLSDSLQKNDHVLFLRI